MGTGIEEVALGLGEAGAAAEGVGLADAALGAGAADAAAGAASTALGGAGLDYGVGSLASGAGFGLANAVAPLGTFEGLTGASGLGLGGIDATALGGTNTALGGAAANLGAPGYISPLSGPALNPAGLYATPTGASLTPYSGVQSLTGVGASSITPTQSLLTETTPSLSGMDYGSSLYQPNLPEFPTPSYQSLADMTNAAQASGITSNLGTDYLNQLGGLPAPNTDGFFKSVWDTINPNSDKGIMDRLGSLGRAGQVAADQIFMDKNGRLNMPSVLAGLSLYPTYALAKQKAQQLNVPFDEATYQANKVSPYKDKFASLAPKSAFGIKAANGGRIGYAEGIGPAGKMSNNRISQLIQLVRDADSKGDKDAADQALLDLYRETKKAKGGRIGYEEGKLVLPKEGPANKATREQMERAAKQAQEEYAKIKAQEELMDKNYKNWSMYDWKKGQKELFDMAPEEGYIYPEPVAPEPITPSQEEGVLSIKLTPAQKKAKGGMMNHPVRMLKGGISELDLRAKGGYIPYGSKEKADDVPAMLSKNEFVFTADAVRNAGGGSVNKGAIKMYKLMKSLENKKINKKKAN